MPYQTDPFMQSGRHHEFPAILSPDDLHPGDAPIWPYPVSQGKHTNPWSIAAGLHGPVPMTWLPALAVVVSHTCRAFSQPSFWLFLQKPLGKIAVCMVHIPPPMAGCLRSTFLTFLVLLPYVLEGLVMFLVPDHPKISSGIS